MDSRIYNQMFGNFPLARTISHQNVPCHNLLSLENVKSITNAADGENGSEVSEEISFDSFPFYKNFPYETDSITILHPGCGLIDRADELVVNKVVWKEKLLRLKPKNINNALKILNSCKSGGNLQSNASLKNYLMHIKADPEPCFDSDYNWLYTGGNIAGFQFHSDYCLITPDEIGDSAVINVIELNDDLKLKKKGKQMKHYLLKNNPVLQICCSHRNDIITAAVRQRKEITLLTLNSSYEVKENWHERMSELVINCDISLDSKMLAAVDSSYNIKIFDIGVQKKIFKTVHEAESKSWAQVLFNDNYDGVYMIDQNSFNLFDLRADSKANVVFKPVGVNDCEVMCNVIKSKYRDSNYYAALTHSLLEVDIRNGKCVQKWTHLMNSVPQFGKVDQSDGRELIILQSSNPEEMIGILNEGKPGDVQYISRSNPTLLNTVKRECWNAQYRGICLQPGIDERLNFSITGLHMTRCSKGRSNVFTINGGYDVVSSTLREKNEESAEEKEDNKSSKYVIKGFKKFEKKCFELNLKQNCNYTMLDMTHVANVLRNKNAKKPKSSSHFRQKHVWPSKEMFKIESLSYYKDFMAERILSVWGVETNNLDDGEDYVTDSELSSKDKVEEWMKEIENRRTHI